MTTLTEVVTLSPGQSKEVGFSVIPTEPGYYSVRVNGLSGSFRLLEAVPTWVSPTGHRDPQGEWSYQGQYSDRYKIENAYDGDDRTLAMSKVLYGIGWSGWLELTHAPLHCDRIKYLLLLSTYGDIVEVEVQYNGDWHLVFTGKPLPYVWEEKTLGGIYLVTGMRFRFYRKYTDKLVACDFYEAVFGAV